MGDWKLGALLAAFCSVGGVLGYVSRSLATSKKVRLIECLVSGLSSAYVCVLTLLLTSLMGWDMLWGAFVAGVLAWMGAEYAMNLYSRIASTKAEK